MQQPRRHHRLPYLNMATVSTPSLSRVIPRMYVELISVGLKRAGIVTLPDHRPSGSNTFHVLGTSDIPFSDPLAGASARFGSRTQRRPSVAAMNSENAGTTSA